MKIQKHCFLYNETLKEFIFIRKKELTNFGIMFEQIDPNSYRVRTFPPKENWYLGYIKAWSSRPANPTWHTEKTRLNRHCRRQVRLWLKNDPDQLEPRLERISKWLKHHDFHS